MQSPTLWFVTYNGQRNKPSFDKEGDARRHAYQLKLRGAKNIRITNNQNNLRSLPA